MIKAWREIVTIPTYEIGKAEKNPIFLEKRVYQGSSGVVYPYPVIESIANEPTPHEWKVVFLENEYIKVMVMPELGGRIQMAYDKIKQRHFVYYNHVIKPALVGLTGPWISGGIEFNWPQHHRPSTYLPVDCDIVENEDGSVTVWVNEMERMFHQKGMAGFTLRPGCAYLEIQGRVSNRTSLPQTFLWWANPAVEVNDAYQSVFPPDVNAVFDHGKRAVSSFPIATGTYYKMDYSAGVDISNYKNIPVPTSYMAVNSKYDFEGGYENDTKGGMLHVASHHFSPGKKQWTWGNGDFGRAWDRNLTDCVGSEKGIVESERQRVGDGTSGMKFASAVFCRGYYTRSVIVAWDWDGKSLKDRWTFDTNNPEWRSYAGQGNHNLRIADVDGDGYDEMTYGSMAVDHDGRGLYNTRMGHGDAIHLIADPKDDRLYIWDCHENKRDGSDLRDAATGKVLFQIKSTADVGRCMAADIDPTNPGVEMWSADSHGIRNMKGEVVNAAKDSDDPQHNNYLVMGGRWLSMNFGIWWDGDLLRELLDRETVSKYDWQNRRIVDLQRFDGQFNNGTKSNPCLAADILGDWREEVLIRNRESTELRLYVTTIPTSYRINCLMQDIPYRLSVAYQNVGYNQPSEPGYYIGPDKTDYLK